ncbi:hypothetical protein [Oceanobacillus kapialis]|uniref:Uncharacterized protein n=1 Tax=Oceanobacillus kapialis TaxID=481353 RepID=A0ABW5Q1Q2_9BACI
MVQAILDKLPGWFVFFNASLAFFIPFFIYWVNKSLHEKGDPEWKKTNDKKDR